MTKCVKGKIQHLPHRLPHLHHRFLTLRQLSPTSNGRSYQRACQILVPCTIIAFISQVLQGLNVVFSGIVPTHIPLRKSRAYKVAKCLGANVSDDINIDSPDSSTRTVHIRKFYHLMEIDVKSRIFQTHLIAARLGTAKVNEARRLKSSGIKVVTPNWLWCCAERWEHIDERLFPLEKKTPGMIINEHH